MTYHPAEPPCPRCGHHPAWAITIRGEYDGVLFWQCPLCRHAWPRFTQGRWNRRANEIITKWKDGVGQ